MFKSKAKDKRDPEEIAIEKKIERDRQYKQFVKQTEKSIAEYITKKEEYRKMAIRARAEGNKQQLATCLKFIKVADVSINRLVQFKAQIDLGKMMADSNKNAATFLETVSSFGENLKDSSVNPVQLQKTLTKFNMEAEKLQTQSESMSDLLSESEEIMNDMFDADVDISEGELDSILGTSNKTPEEKDAIDKELDALISKI